MLKRWQANGGQSAYEFDEQAPPDINAHVEPSAADMAIFPFQERTLHIDQHFAHTTVARSSFLELRLESTLMDVVQPFVVAVAGLLSLHLYIRSAVHIHSFRGRYP